MEVFLYYHILLLNKYRDYYSPVNNQYSSWGNNYSGSSNNVNSWGSNYSGSSNNVNN